MKLENICKNCNRNKYLTRLTRKYEKGQLIQELCYLTKKLSIEELDEYQKKRYDYCLENNIDFQIRKTIVSDEKGFFKQLKRFQKKVIEIKEDCPYQFQVQLLILNE